jgi:hypothetical protein
MQSELELFYWSYPEAGFEWVDAIPMPGLQDSDRALVEHEKRFLAERKADQPRYIRYNPLVVEPLLFRKFIETEPTEEGFLAFANQYGDLGVGVLVGRKTDDKTVRGGLRGHDPFFRWFAAHHRMRGLVEVLTAIQQADAVTLRQWFQIVEGGARYVRDDGVAKEWSWITIPQHHLRDYLWDWAMAAPNEDEAIIRIAQGWAQGKLNEAVSGDDSPSTVRVVFDRDTPKMSLRVCPSNLLAALWLQCARVLALNPTRARNPKPTSASISQPSTSPARRRGRQPRARPSS